MATPQLCRNRPVGLAPSFVVGFLCDGWQVVLRLALAGVRRTFAVLNSTFCIEFRLRHIWGDQPYGTADSSRNSWLVLPSARATNHHHTFPKRLSQRPALGQFRSLEVADSHPLQPGLASFHFARLSGIDQTAPGFPDPIPPFAPDPPRIGKTSGP